MSEVKSCEACFSRLLDGRSGKALQPGTRVLFASAPDIGRFTMQLCKEHAAVGRRIYSAPQCYVTSPENPGRMIPGRYQ